MSEPHYLCAITQEMLPEDETTGVSVYNIQADGHNHFKKELVGTVRVNESIPQLDGYVGAELLTAFGEVVMVYKEDKHYGRGHDPSDLSSTEMETWGIVAETARQSDQ